jgi:hypothetical protein
MGLWLRTREKIGTRHRLPYGRGSVALSLLSRERQRPAASFSPYEITDFLTVAVR